MPFLPIDLDGKKKWPMVASGCGVALDKVYRGFVELWELVWTTKRDRVGLLQLECLFGAPGERVGAVLEAFGFLETMDGDWRVRGAAKWLRVMGSKSAGGQTSAARPRDDKGRLLPAASDHEMPKTHPAPIQDPPKTQPADIQLFHPTPNTQHPKDKEEEEKALAELWNENAHPSLSRCRELTDKRKPKARERLKERPLTEWELVIARISASAFCCGENARGWRADFDWLLKPDTATKVLEGKYDNRGGQGPAPPAEVCACSVCGSTRGDLWPADGGHTLCGRHLLELQDSGEIEQAEAWIARRRGGDMAQAGAP